MAMSRRAWAARKKSERTASGDAAGGIPSQVQEADTAAPKQSQSQKHKLRSVEKDKKDKINHSFYTRLDSILHRYAAIQGGDAGNTDQEPAEASDAEMRVRDRVGRARSTKADGESQASKDRGAHGIDLPSTASRLSIGSELRA